MFSIAKWFSGFNVANGEKLGKLVFYFILIAIGIGAYHSIFLKRTIRNDIQAQTVIMEAEHRDAFVLIKLWKLRVFSIE